MSLYAGRKVSRREFVRATSLLVAAAAGEKTGLSLALSDPLSAAAPLAEFGYGSVALFSELHEAQLTQTLAVLMGLSEDSLLKPFREMAGRAAPGEDIGGWYQYLPDYDYRTGDAGLAPGSTFGQWISALSRGYAATGSREMRDKVLRLNRLYAETLSGEYYKKTRFPAYSYDKMICGLMDAHQFAGDADAFEILQRTTEAALRIFQGRRSTVSEVGLPTGICRSTGMSRTRCQRTCFLCINAVRERNIARLECSISTTKPFSIRWHAEKTYSVASTPRRM